MCIRGKHETSAQLTNRRGKCTTDLVENPCRLTLGHCSSQSIHRQRRWGACGIFLRLKLLLQRPAHPYHNRYSMCFRVTLNADLMECLHSQAWYCPHAAAAWRAAAEHSAGSALHDGHSVLVQQCARSWLRLALCRLHQRVSQQLELCEQPCKHSNSVTRVEPQCYRFYHAAWSISLGSKHNTCS